MEKMDHHFNKPDDVNQEVKKKEANRPIFGSFLGINCKKDCLSLLAVDSSILSSTSGDRCRGILE